MKRLLGYVEIIQFILGVTDKLCNDSTGYKEAGDNTNIEAYTMINVPYECYLDKDWF